MTHTDWSGMPSPDDVARASRAKLVVTSVRVGIPSCSSCTESRTLRDVHDPQSACETITRSGSRSAIDWITSAFSSLSETDSGSVSQ